MNTTRARFSLLAALLASLLPMRAVELRFLNMDGPEHSLRFTDQGRSVSISADDSSFSPAYTYGSTGPLVLFKESVINGKPVRTPAAQIEIPAALTHAVIVLSATDKSLTTYSGICLDDSPSTRPAGTLLVLNGSHLPLSFRLSAEQFALSPGGVRQLPLAGDTHRVVLQAEARIDGTWRRIFGNPLPVRTGARVLLLLRDGRPQPGSNPNLVDMLTFYDQPSAPPDSLPAP